MEICEKSICTGCFSCYNICPEDCISMREDEFGEIHPHINNELCIKCGLCITHCPNNNDLLFKKPLKTFAGWRKSGDKRRLSASGGIGAVLYENIVDQNGVVYGTVWDDNFNAVFVRKDYINDLDVFKGSKYVQSNIGSVFKDVKNDLLNNLNVLFIGTPCQIAGLLVFLEDKFENLMTCDLICHGVTPGSYLKNEIAFLKNKLKIKSISDCRFRGNDGNNFFLTLWDKNLLNYKKEYRYQFYFDGFLSGLILRESCYSCRYSKQDRISDFSIGDFIGLGRKEPFEHSKKNVSVILVNTKKGLSWFNENILNDKEVCFVERTLQEAVEGGKSLREPFFKHYNRNKFRRLYKEKGWKVAIRKSLRKDFIKKYTIKYISYCWRLPLKIRSLILRRLIHEK